MRTRLVIVSLSAFTLLATSALAGETRSCNGKVINGQQTITDHQMLIDKQFAKDGEASALYFLLPDGKIERLAINPDGNKIDVPSKLAAKLAKSGEVEVYNKTESSIYLMPFPVSGVHGINPKTDFTNAEHAGRGCSRVNLKGQETISVIYNDIARVADKVTYIDRVAAKRARTKSEEALYAESITILKKKLGTTTRSPASLARPEYADDPKVNQQRKSKTLPIVPYGTPTKPRPAQNSGSGN
jgi:hypothetical protein